jgi:hypothetical protein
MLSWPPKPGELWVAVEHWPPYSEKPAIKEGDFVMVMTWNPDSPCGTTNGRLWFEGQVLGSAGIRTIRALPGDLIPSDDPRIGATPR